jgi:histone-lysine N-methyltransferase SETMAR
MAAGELDMSKEAVRNIVLQDLGMRKLVVKLVARNLTEEQKDRRLTLCMDFAELLQEDNILDRVITGDESWSYQYDSEAKHQSVEWRSKNSPRPKKPRMSKYKTKTMLIYFFEIRGIIQFKFTPEGATANQTFYVEVLKRHIDAVRRQRRELWRYKSLFLHHDNSPARSTFRVSQFSAGKGISATDHPPYSPNLAPTDFSLSPKLESVLKAFL